MSEKSWLAAARPEPQSGHGFRRRFPRSSFAFLVFEAGAVCSRSRSRIDGGSICLGAGQPVKASRRLPLRKSEKKAEEKVSSASRHLSSSTGAGAGASWAEQWATLMSMTERFERGRVRMRSFLRSSGQRKTTAFNNASAPPKRLCRPAIPSDPTRQGASATPAHSSAAAPPRPTPGDRDGLPATETGRSLLRPHVR